MPLQRFENGEPFPKPLPRGQEGLFPMLAGESLLVAIVLLEASPADQHKIAKKALRIGALSYDSVPFLVTQFEGFGVLDGSMNPYQYDEKYRADFLEGEENAIHFCMTEGTDHIIRAQRLVGVEAEIMDFLRSAYRECIETYDDEAEVNRKVREAYQAWPVPNGMLKDASHTQTFY